MKTIAVRLILAFTFFECFSGYAFSVPEPLPAINETSSKANISLAQARSKPDGTNPASTGLQAPVSSSTSPSAVVPSTSSPPSLITSNKELVVVSKTPEFFTYTLSTISVLLTVVTILVAIITGVGLLILVRVSREKERFKAIKSSFEKEQKAVRDTFQRDYEKMVEMLRRTAFGMTAVHRAKRELRDILSMSDPSAKDAYLTLQKTIPYPDAECLRLYAKALAKFENNVDIVRVVRNGILEFSRNPENVPREDAGVSGLQKSYAGSMGSDLNTDI